MNEQNVIKHMIEYVEKKEKELQSRKMSADPQAKSDVVKSILDELERVMANED